MYILDQVVLSLRPGYSHFWARLFNIISRLYCSACQTTRCQGSKRESAATPLPMHLGWGGASSWSNRPTRPEVPYITTYLRESLVRPWSITMSTSHSMMKNNSVLKLHAVFHSILTRLQLQLVNMLGYKKFNLQLNTALPMCEPNLLLTTRDKGIF